MANLRTIDYKGFNYATGSAGPGFIMWSGSVELSESADNRTVYDGLGFEIIKDSGSFMRFATNPSDFTVRTEKFYLGNNNQFISGSNGILRISSSNFHLAADGTLTLGGTINATGGQIAGWKIVGNKLSGSNATLDADGAALYMSTKGPGTDTSATFDIRRDEYYIDFTPTDQSANRQYYVKFGPNFAVSSSGVLIASGAVFEGTITASAGKIGGFSIGEDDLSATNILINSSTPKITLGSKGTLTDSNTGLYLGTDGIALGASSVFKVTSAGELTATSGTIAGWNISSTQISKIDSGGGIKIDSNNKEIGFRTGSNVDTTILTLGEITTGKFGILGKDSSDTSKTVFKLGEDGNEIAGWKFDDKQISSSNLIISSSGTIQTTDFQDGITTGVSQGWKISSDGEANFANATIRGTLSTTVFEKEKVSAVGGALIVANATTIVSGALHLSGSIDDNGRQVISCSNIGGFTTGEYILAKATSSTGFIEEYMQVMSVTASSNTMDVKRGMNKGQKITSMSSGQVLVSQGNEGTGYILLNATSGSETPYIDIVERVNIDTAASPDSLSIKARLGDLSGINDNVNGKSVSGFGLYTDNAFLKGGIAATYGSIGGFAITGGHISSSNNKLIMSSSGIITGSNVKFDGGTIGGFALTTNAISSSNDNIILRSNGSVTASAIKISGNSEFTGVVNVGNGSTVPGIGVYQHGPLTHHPRSAGTPSNDILPNGTFNDTQDNAVEYVTGPFGGQELAIVAYPDGTSDADGGFNSDPFPIDSGSAYMFVCYIKRRTSATLGTQYFGTEGFNSSDGSVDDFILSNTSDTPVNDNPYFFTGDITASNFSSYANTAAAVAGSLNKWFLHIGYVYPSGSAHDETRKSVVYDLETGLTASYSGTNGATYIWRAGCTHGRIRAYHYYNTSGDGNTPYAEFARPGVFKMDGSEPTIQSLLSNISQGGNTQIDGSTITTGKIQSNNLSTTAGSEFNLNDGTIKMGGTSNPNLEFDGSTLTLEGQVIAGNITERYVVINDSNQSQFLATNGGGKNIVLDGSLGGTICVNAEISTSTAFEIKDIILPFTGSDKVEANIYIQTSGMTFDEGTIQSSMAQYMELSNDQR